MQILRVLVVLFTLPLLVRLTGFTMTGPPALITALLITAWLLDWRMPSR